MNDDKPRGIVVWRNVKPATLAIVRQRLAAAGELGGARNDLCAGISRGTAKNAMLSLQADGEAFLWGRGPWTRYFGKKEWADMQLTARQRKKKQKLPKVPKVLASKPEKPKKKPAVKMAPAPKAAKVLAVAKAPALTVVKPKPPPRAASFHEAEPTNPRGIKPEKGLCGKDYRYTAKPGEYAPFFSLGGRLPLSGWAAAVVGERV